MIMHLFSGIDRHSITFKITLSIALSSLILMMLLGIINTRFIKTEYLQLEQEKLTTIMNDALKTLGVNLSYEFHEAVKETGEDLLQDLNILQVRIRSSITGNEFFFSRPGEKEKLEGFFKKMSIDDPVTEKEIGELIVTYSRENYKAMMLKYYRNLTILLAIYLIFAVYLIRLMVNLLNPLGGLARQLRDFSPNKAKIRLPYDPERKDEIYRIAMAGNAMLDSIYDFSNRQNQLNRQLLKARNELEKRVEERTAELREKQMQLAHAGRLVALGELAAGIAHELGQPLQIIQTAAAILTEEMKSDDMNRLEVQSIAAKITPQVDRASSIIKNIRTFARYDMETSAMAVDLKKPLTECLGFFHEQFKQHDIKVKVEITENLPKVRTEPQKFQQIVVNLLSNARYAVDYKYPLQNAAPDYEKIIAITLYRDVSANKVILEVRDNGKGMSQEELRRCQEPFFTTKSPDKGTGLGLSIVYGIAKEFEFQLKISSVQGQGTVCKVKMDAVTAIPLNDNEKGKNITP